MNNGLEAFADYQQAINAAMPHAFSDFPDLLGSTLSRPAQEALEKLEEYSTRPGKRIRGSLAAAAYDQAANTKLGSAGIQLGVALELMQDYLLIVDDVMDKSAIRRGEPTIHELYLNRTNVQTDIHEAQMTAVNVGLIAQHMASLVVARIDENSHAIQEASQRLQANIAITGFGQLDDLYQQIGRPINTADILRKYESKSSYYTFINPLQCGFALAGKSDSNTMKDCHEFGLPAGVAFQLHDDYLGIFSDQTELGKPNLDDIREGKYTLLVHYALEHASTDDVMTLMSQLNNDAIDVAGLQTVREIFERSGSLKYVQSETERHAKRAMKAAHTGTSWNNSFGLLLESLVAFSVTRIK